MREPSPVDADLEEALKRSMEDANVYRHQQDDSYRALEAANDAALRRALEESVREQRQVGLFPLALCSHPCSSSLSLRANRLFLFVFVGRIACSQDGD